MSTNCFRDVVVPTKNHYRRLSARERDFDNSVARNARKHAFTDRLVKHSGSLREFVKVNNYVICFIDIRNLNIILSVF